MQVRDSRRNSYSLWFTTFFIITVILLLAFVTNPGIRSFAKYQYSRAEKKLGPVGAVLSNLDLWMSTKINTIRVDNYHFFTIISGKTNPPFGNLDKCSMLGIFGSWFPICFRFMLPDCSGLGGCSNLGICYANNQCLCLPSAKTDRRCSARVLGYEEFTLFGLFPKGLFGLSILEVIMIVSVIFQVSCYFWPNFRDWVCASWKNSIRGLCLWQIFTSSLIHHNLLHLLYNLYCFYSIAPEMYSTFSEGNFISFFAFSSALGSILGMTFERFQKDPRGGSNFVCGLTPFLVSSKIFHLLSTLSFSNPRNYFAFLPKLVRYILADVIIEYVVNEKFNPGPLIAGILNGYTFYNGAISL